MDQDKTILFLLKAAIPEVTEKNKLPPDLQWEKNKKKEKEQEPSYKSKKLVWDCISRAHRDVLSGRKNVEKYSKNIKLNTKVNQFALDLYNAITNPTADNHICSEKLIENLLPENKEGIGAIQKLVNMTLKYMFLLQMYDVLDTFTVYEADCDCPLDSIILESLGKGQHKWTKDFKINDNDDGYEIYKKIQCEIKKKQGSKSKLSYDFENWKPFYQNQN